MELSVGCRAHGGGCHVAQPGPDLCHARLIAHQAPGHDVRADGRGEEVTETLRMERTPLQTLGKDRL